MIDTGLTCLVGSHALFIERSRSAFLVVDIGVREPRFTDVIASGRQLAESCPVNAIVEAVTLFLLTYVASFHHVLRLSATLTVHSPSLRGAGRPPSCIVIQRATITRVYDPNTLDITYFATDHNESNTLEPTLIDSDLTISDLGHNEVILDSAFENEGIHVGDRVIDKISEQELTVVAFAKRANYGYSDIGFVSSQTYAAMRTVTVPNYEWQAQTVVTSDEIEQGALPSHLMTADRQQVIDKIPGYKAQNLTLKVITWVLLVASSAILGVFFYILTLQKLRQFDVLKAIGMPMRTITYIQISQLTIISIIGVAIGLGLAASMAPFLPSTVPSIMTLADSVTVAISFVVTSILCGALSLLKIKKVDPIEVIGGNGE